MKGYVDLFVLPIPKKNLARYRKMAQRFSKIVKDHGALEYREFLGDDLKTKMAVSFTSIVKLKAGEVLISLMIEFRSKKHRDQINKLTWKDPRMQKMMKEKLWFDPKRMVYGGFETFVKM